MNHSSRGWHGILSPAECAVNSGVTGSPSMRFTFSLTHEWTEERVYVATNRFFIRDVTSERAARLVEDS